MSQPKDPKRYPPRVRAIPYYLKHCPKGEKFRIPFDTKNEALGFRAAVYGFRAAVLACRNDVKLQEKYHWHILSWEDWIEEYGADFEYAQFLVEQSEGQWWFVFRAASIPGEDLLPMLQADLEKRTGKPFQDPLEQRRAELSRQEALKEGAAPSGDAQTNHQP